MSAAWQEKMRQQVEAELARQQTSIPENGKAAAASAANRVVAFTAASEIKVRPVRWAWENRLPVGAVSLLGGREGIGKSTCAYTLGAQLTKGTLAGAYYGEPRSVIIAATEDSWSHTIVPRLMAAGADLDRVFRVDVMTTEGFGSELSLPVDIPALKERAAQEGAAMLLLDPLLSRLSPSLDSHKDAEVRQALEPVSRLAADSGIAVLGIIHVNKSGSSDPLSLIMGSRAFVAVARAVLFAMTDPEDDDGCLLGQPKNNLGRLDLPTLTYKIEGAKVAETDEGDVWTGQLHWTGDTDRTVGDALDAASRGEDRSAVEEATVWLEDYLMSKGGAEQSSTIKAAAKPAGHSGRTLQRARARLKVTTESIGFPRQTYWLLPGAPVPDVPEEKT
jgi:RecA-family ATPase